MLDITLIPVLDDNYAYILQSDNDVGVLDAGDAAPVIQKLEELNLEPTVIFNTHHHSDHIAGNDALRGKYNCDIIAPAYETDRILNIHHAVKDGDIFDFGDEKVTVFHTPGHTTGHICFWFKDSQNLFSGDTLFAMGCGRLFEGNAGDMFDNFQKFNAIPDKTKIYCGHEYTQTNGNFCLSVDPDNQDLKARMAEVKNFRNKNIPTIPTTIELEKKTNIFMRAKSVEEFAHYRNLRDNF